MALIKLLFRDDEEVRVYSSSISESFDFTTHVGIKDQTIFSMIDTSGSFNILLQLLEPMTFAEVIKQYMESDRRVVENGEEALEIMQRSNYPFVGMSERLTVLKW